MRSGNWLYINNTSNYIKCVYKKDSCEKQVPQQQIEVIKIGYKSFVLRFGVLYYIYDSIIFAKKHLNELINQYITYKDLVKISQIETTDSIVIDILLNLKIKNRFECSSGNSNIDTNQIKHLIFKKMYKVVKHDKDN